MFSHLWRRLTGARDVPALASPGPAVHEEAVREEPAAATPAAVGLAAAAAPVANPPAPGPAATPDGPRVATPESLLRSLTWRSKVLLEGAGREAHASDGPALVEALRNATDSVIRQPPEAATRALLVARNPNSPLAKIVVLFEHDPMLAQALLRQANSAYFRRDGQPCTSLYAAVQRIGISGVQGILMASMVQNMLCRPGGAYDALVQKVWKHMERTAPVARALAPAFRIDPDSAYSLALLHDVGKLIVFDHVSSLRHDLRREMRLTEPFFGQLLGHLHEPLGGLAALKWEMGGEAAHALGEHHRRPVPEGADPITECLYVSEAVDLAHTNFTKLDWEQIWLDGGITTDVVHVQDRLRRMEE